MDYKYIEQLLERYWQCETTLQEEAILRAFFSQDEVPAALQKYKTLFADGLRQEETLGGDFDARILSIVGQEAPKARTVSLTSRLMPLFKAAAVVAIILTLGNAAQAPWDRGWDSASESHAQLEAQQADTVNVLGTIRAENRPDSAKATPAEEPAYLE